MERIICYQCLNLKVENIISDIEKIPFSIEKDFSVVRCDPKIYLDDNFYHLLSQFGQLSSLVFYMKSFVDKKNIHIDLDKTTRSPLWPSLNIIIKGQGIMKWFNPIGEGNYGYSFSGKVFYKKWEEKNYGKIIDEWVQGKVALVRTDIPHNVWNPFDQERLMVSIRWDKRHSWEETLKFVESII